MVCSDISTDAMSVEEAIALAVKAVPDMEPFDDSL